MRGLPVSVQLIHATASECGVLGLEFILQLRALLAILHAELHKLATLRDLIWDFIRAVQNAFGLVSQAFLMIDGQVWHARSVLLRANFGRSWSTLLRDAHVGNLSRLE